jgi:hypothetical protein
MTTYYESDDTRSSGAGDDLGATTAPSDMATSESEMRALTSDMVDAHRDSFPQMRASIAEWREVEGETARRSLSRRGLLAAAGAMIAGGVALATLPAAAATRPGLRAGAARGALPDTAGSVPLDVVVAGLAASLENLAVATYAAALKAAGAHKLGVVPAAIGDFATTAMAQHKDHAAAWNSVLASARYKPITAANPVYAKIVDDDFAKVKSVTGVAELALTLEGVAAATYLEAIKALSTPAAVAIAASIQPVEMQHVAILNFVLGRYPAPLAFASLAGAAPVSTAHGLDFAKS